MSHENLSTIDAVLTEIRHFEVGLVVSSAHHSVAYEHTAIYPSAFSQKFFSRPNEATVELPDCIERLLVPFGTFCKWFNCQKATNSFTHFASNCPGSTYGVFPPGLLFNFSKISHRKTTGPISTICKPHIEGTSAHISLENGGDLY